MRRRRGALYAVRSLTFILSEFWDLGHKLFRSTPETYPATFIPDNAFDAKYLEIVAPFTTTNPPPVALASLSELTSLNPLRGRVSAIHASLLFHLFSEQERLHLARVLGALLSPEPGSMIFGTHRRLPEKGVTLASGEDQAGMFCHSTGSWTELWNGVVFEKGTVRVDATMVDVKREESLTCKSTHCFGV